MVNSLVIIALKYLEPEYAQTLACIEATGLPVIWADRDGVGNYARAFNEAFKKGASQYQLAWMVSNISFAPEVPLQLAKAFEKVPNLAAVHPAMPGSDHPHQWPGPGAVQPVSFIEWTAPMVHTSFFSELMLNEALAYYYMDLDFSYRARQAGYTLAVDPQCQISHLYLRHKKTDHPISTLRRQLRDWWTPHSRQEMQRLYGPDWEKLMQWKK